MADPIKIRAQFQGETTEIRILLQHAMETGQRKDERGQAVASHFIQQFSVSHNGRQMIDGQLNTSISKNPLFVFRASGIKPGDKLGVSWIDNTGDKRTDEITIA